MVAGAGGEVGDGGGAGRAHPLQNEIAIEAGGGEIVDGKAAAFAVQTAEKVYLSFQLEVRNKGGHSSVPGPDNAIYRLSAALNRLAAHAFPVRLNETTREYFTRLATISPPEDAARYRAIVAGGAAQAEADAHFVLHEPRHASMLRTSVSPNIIQGGYRVNVIPSEARATLDVRVHPDDDVEAFVEELRRVIDDTAIELSFVPRSLRPKSAPVPLDVSTMTPAERVWTEKLAAKLEVALAVEETVETITPAAVEGLERVPLPWPLKQRLMKRLLREVIIAPPLEDYVVRLVHASHPPNAAEPSSERPAHEALVLRQADIEPQRVTMLRAFLPILEHSVSARNARIGGLQVGNFVLDACLQVVVHASVCMLRRRLFDLTGRHALRCVIEPLGVVHEFHVRARMGAARLDVGSVVLLLRHDLGEVAVQALLGPVRDELRQTVQLAVFDRLVGRRDGRLDRAGGLQAGIRRAFAGAVHAHQRLEEIQVGELLGLAAGLAHGRFHSCPAPQALFQQGQTRAYQLPRGWRARVAPGISVEQRVVPLVELPAQACILRE